MKPTCCIGPCDQPHMARGWCRLQFFVRDGVNWVEQVRNPHGGFQPYPYGVTQPWAEAVWVGEFAPLVTNP